MSSAASVTHTSPIHQGRAAHIALWVVQIALAGMFLLAGGSKLFGAAADGGTVRCHRDRSVVPRPTGLIEVGSAVALLMPTFAVFGAFALVPTMVGAIATQLFIVGGSPADARGPAVWIGGVLMARRHQLRSLPVGALTGGIGELVPLYSGKAGAAEKRPGW